MGHSLQHSVISHTEAVNIFRMFKFLCAGRKGSLLEESDLLANPKPDSRGEIQELTPRGLKESNGPCAPGFWHRPSYLYRS